VDWGAEQSGWRGAEITRFCAKQTLQLNTMRAKRFSDQIRDAVNASGLSRYAICKAIGFNQGAMSRFMAGRGGLSTEILDRLAELLGLEVVAKLKKDR
jgi:hypothetical protein